jgi:hypothetical protein
MELGREELWWHGCCRKLYPRRGRCAISVGQDGDPSRRRNKGKGAEVRTDGLGITFDQSPTGGAERIGSLGRSNPCSAH